MPRRQQSDTNEAENQSTPLLPSARGEDAEDANRPVRRGSLRTVNLESVLKDGTRPQNSQSSLKEQRLIAQTTLSFIDEFELINGVPAFVLEASHHEDNDARSACCFMCHGFSDNGAWLAVGDSLGSVRVWKTEHFKLHLTYTLSSGNRVGCVRFVAGSDRKLVACDIFGCCDQFSLDGQLLKTWSLQAVQTLKEQFFVNNDDLAVTVAMDPTETVAQLWPPFASDDGTVIAQAISTRISHQSFLGKVHIFLSLLKEENVEMLKVESDYRSLVSRAELSEDGSMLLVVYAPPLTHELEEGGDGLRDCLEIWTTISNVSTTQFRHVLPCRMGAFANRGEYVIGWTSGSTSGSTNRQTEIIVWKATSLKATRRLQPSRHARRVMEQDETIFHVEMISPSRGDTGDDVTLAICFAERNESTLLIHIWDAKQNATLLQFPTKTSFKDTLVGRRQYLNQPEVMSCYWGHNELDIERSLIKICQSPDKKWIAFYSSEVNEGFLWSRGDAIPVSKLDLPPQLADDGMNVIEAMKTTVFSPAGDSVFLIGRYRLIAFVPAFLQKNRGMQMTHLYSPEGTYIAYKRLTLSHNGATLAVAAEQKMTNVSTVSNRFGPAFIDLAKNRPSGIALTDSDQSEYKTALKDYCLNRDGSIIAYIFVDNTVALARTGDALWDPILKFKRFSNDSLLRVLSSSKEHIYNKICFTQISTGYEELVCFSLQKKGSITWFDIQSLQQICSIPFSVDQFLGMKLNLLKAQAVILGTQTAQIIDLEMRQLEKVIYFATSIPRARQILTSTAQNSSEVFFDDIEALQVSCDGSTVLIGWHVGKKRPIYINSTTNSRRLKHFAKSLTDGINTNVWLSDMGRWIAVATKEEIDDKVYKELRIYDTTEERACRVIPDGLDSSGCRPLFEISGDGRILVTRSVFETTKGNSTLFDVLVILTPYAIKGSIPDYERLRLTRKVENKGSIKALIREFSWPLLNHPDFEDKTLFVHCLTNHMTEWVDALYDLGKDEGIPINLFWNELSDNGEWTKTNALQWAINTRSITLIDAQLARLQDQATTVEATAKILRYSLPELYMTFPTRFMELMESDALIATFGVAPIAAKVFEDTSFLVGTDSNAITWEPKVPLQVLKLWKSMGAANLEAQILNGKKQAELPSQTELVLIKDVAQVGMCGILRYLLMREVPSDVFKTRIVQWVIAFKWQTYGAKACFSDLTKYLIFYVVFNVYAIILGDGSRVGNELKDYLMLIPLLVSIVYAGLNLQGEYIQINRYQSDALKAFGDRAIGIRHYFKSYWNWIEMISYVLLIPLPIIHCLAAKAENGEILESILSVCVSIESLLLGWKVLYYAQAFRASGPLVLAIREVVLDVLVFMVLVFMILLGFALAFFVLSRHMEDGRDGFNHFPTALLTTYTTMLGDFDIDAYKETKLVWWLMVTLFVLYTFTMMIMLLNLLIGIMSDSFDRVRSAQQAEFLRGRASVIDDCEAAMTDNELKELEAKIGTYLYSLSPLKAVQEVEDWTGKIRAFEKVVEKKVTIGQRQLAQELDSIKQSIEQLRQAVVPPQPHE